MCVGLRGRQPVRAARPRRVPRRAAASSPRPPGDGGGKLGLADTTRLALLPGDAHLGPRLAAVAARARRRGRAARCATGGSRSCSCPAPLLLFLFLGSQDALLRALDAAGLPAPVPARGVGGRRARDVARARRAARRRAAGAGALLCSRRASCSASTTTSCWPAPTRASSRATGWSPTSRSGTKVVVEPIAPDQWATDAGQPLFGRRDRQRQPLEQVARRRARCFNNDGTITRARARVVKLEDYERTTRPRARRRLRRGGFCWVVTGSTQYGRAFADPQEVPDALRYYDELAPAAKSCSASARTARTPRACRSRSTTRSTTTR